MFEREEVTPWYRSVAGIIVAGILVPPVGAVLVWLRKDWATKVKIAGTVALVILSASYIFLIRAWRRSDFNENQYSVLEQDRKSTRLNSSHSQISYAVFCLKKKNINHRNK